MLQIIHIDRDCEVKKNRDKDIYKEREMEGMKVTEISSSKMFEGYNKRYKHYSQTLGCSMTFHIYFPPPPKSASPDSHKFPVSSFPNHNLFSYVCLCVSVCVFCS